MGAEALRAILGQGAEGWESEQLLQAVRYKVLRACPLEIVIIPKVFPTLRNTTRQQQERILGSSRSECFNTFVTQPL